MASARGSRQCGNTDIGAAAQRCRLGYRRLARRPSGGCRSLNVLPAKFWTGRRTVPQVPQPWEPSRSAFDDAQPEENNLPKAVIFDVDGTLVDSVDLHAKAWQDGFATV